MPIPARAQLLEFVERVAKIPLPTEGGFPSHEADSNALLDLILRAREITGEPAISQTPDYQQARGCAPSLTGLSPEEAIRRVRGAI